MEAFKSIIVFGEWDISQAVSFFSGERYKVRVPILGIVRHTDFEPEKGPTNGNDIVVFKLIFKY